MYLTVKVRFAWAKSNHLLLRLIESNRSWKFLKLNKLPTLAFLLVRSGWGTTEIHAEQDGFLEGRIAFCEQESRCQLTSRAVCTQGSCPGRQGRRLFSQGVGRVLGMEEGAEWGEDKGYVKGKSLLQKMPTVQVKSMGLRGHCGEGQGDLAF